MRVFQKAFRPYNERQLRWTDAVDLCRAFSIDVDVCKVRQDALAVRRLGKGRILVSDRAHLETWGVFCVVHELAHLAFHPGTREYYLGSPGWYSHAESQANVLALVALAPHKLELPYPRILQLEDADSAIALHLGVTTTSGPYAEARLMSRKLVLQRYRDR